MNKDKKNVCIGLLAHVDAGKTTLSEALLYQAGVLKNPGRVDKGDAYLDTFAMEKERGITIFSKQAVFSWEDMTDLEEDIAAIEDVEDLEIVNQLTEGKKAEEANKERLVPSGMKELIPEPETEEELIEQAVEETSEDVPEDAGAIEAGEAEPEEEEILEVEEAEPEEEEILEVEEAEPKVSAEIESLSFFIS